MHEPLSKETLLERGYCCGNSCQNCPYEPKHQRGAMMVADESLDESEE